MAKLIRCRSGHVYDKEAHPSCPECARTESLEAEGGAAPGSDGGDQGGSKPALPFNVFALGGAAAVVLIAVGAFLLWPSSTPAPGNKTEMQPSSAMLDPASDPDFQACAKAVNDQQPCDRAIASGKFNDVPLARLYLIRGFRRNAQHNAEAAFSDFSEAIKLEPNNAFALAGLGSVYAGKGDCTPALEKLDQSIRLDPSILVAYVGRGGCLWKKGDLDGARADYQKALSLNPDPATKKSVERVLELMASAAPANPGAAPSSSAAGAPPATSDSKPAGAP